MLAWRFQMVEWQWEHWKAERAARRMAEEQAHMQWVEQQFSGKNLPKDGTLSPQQYQILQQVYEQFQFQHPPGVTDPGQFSPPVPGLPPGFP
jgi:hypothetical protein